MYGFKNAKMFKSICLILASSIICMSCHTTTYVSLQGEYNEKIVGKNYAEVIELLGPPDRTTPDGKDGEILIYEVKSQQGYSANGKYTSSINLTESKMKTSIYMNSNKTCYKVETDDKKPVKKFSKGRTLALVLPLGIGGPFLLTLMYLAAESAENTNY